VKFSQLLLFVSRLPADRRREIGTGAALGR
jgi:hypothetical protein